MSATCSTPKAELVRACISARGHERSTMQAMLYQMEVHAARAWAEILATLHESPGWRPENVIELRGWRRTLIQIRTLRLTGKVIQFQDRRTA